VGLADLGWTAADADAWDAIGAPGSPGRVMRLDRGWSSVARSVEGAVLRVRNIGVDVAVGDWVVSDASDERIEHVITRRSAFVRRASFEGARAEAHVVAANVDTVFLVHSLSSPPNQRRLERELVLGFDSGAAPVVVLNKLDAPEPDTDVAETVEAIRSVAAGVPVHLTSGHTGVGVDELRGYARGHRTVAFLGASGVGKSTLVNALVGGDVQATGEVRAGDQRGRHTTVAAELVPLPAVDPAGRGWLLDTPGMRAVSLWLSGRGIEAAFADVFALMDDCRFRDCKHDREPGCAVRAAIESGVLEPARFASLERLVAEEAALEEEQREVERAQDRRGVRKRS
jgi:ribosome biogenesis GTPase / thiamine phosphate phosphatase